MIAGAGIERSPERKVITVDQVWALADAVEPRYRALVLTAAFTGCAGESCLGSPGAGSTCSIARSK